MSLATLPYLRALVDEAFREGGNMHWTPTPVDPIALYLWTAHRRGVPALIAAWVSAAALREGGTKTAASFATVLLDFLREEDPWGVWALAILLRAAGVEAWIPAGGSCFELEAAGVAPSETYRELRSNREVIANFEAATQVVRGGPLSPTRRSYTFPPTDRRPWSTDIRQLQRLRKAGLG